MIRTAPLAVRNRFAETVLAARHDAGARAALAELVRRCDAGAPTGWLGDDEGAHGAALCARARAAAAAFASRPLTGAEPDLAETLDDAGRLFDARLYFEVHELLEPHWARATGAEREALQGLVQIAVGYQHGANGNVAGARALLTEGAARVHGRALASLPVEPFAQAVLASVATLPRIDWNAVPRFPRVPADDGARHRP